MEKLLFSGLLLLALLAGCKSSRKAATGAFSPPVSETGAVVKPKVFTMPEMKEAVPAAEEERSIPVRREAITFTQPQDQTTNNYFIIIGSFSYMENASGFRQTLLTEGFKPIIVQSETGFYRVTVDSFDNEAEARQRLLQIRQDYPRYADTWLLIKQ